MPIISVITAVVAGKHQYLIGAWESLTAQQMPDGWSWEWIVQEDGLTGEPAACLPDDDRIKPAVGRRGGAGVARTMGLARAEGDLVRALDADDLLTTGALARDIATMEEHPEIGWCISSCIDLLPDGSCKHGPNDPPAGPLSAETLRRQLKEDQFPVVGTHLVMRRDLAWALGAWPAYPALEALALVLFCAAVAPGLMIKEPGGFYRKHDTMTTARPGYREDVNVPLLRDSILARMDALRASGWTWLPAAEKGH
ncbi:glycosyltransferase family 2 protein [Streptomyces niveus]|uniref:glycosyltransferase family 2 protein n=1 Tax=Streptomyces niveus TaxID=193462 RepID=UPI00367D1EF6